MIHAIPYEELFGMNLQEYEKFLQEGIDRALACARNSYTKKKTNHLIGAVVVTDDHQFACGSHVAPDTIYKASCSEQRAIKAALTRGILVDPEKDKPGSYIKAIFIATHEQAAPILPCGECRQMISTYALNDNALVIGAGKNGLDFKKKDGGIKIRTIGYLLQEPYESNTTKKKKRFKAQHEAQGPIPSRYAYGVEDDDSSEIKELRDVYEEYRTPKGALHPIYDRRGRM